MSRFGDDYDGELPLECWETIHWNVTHGRRGKAFLTMLVEALDAMPVHALAEGQFINAKTGQMCALGAMAAYKKVKDGEAEDWAVAMRLLDDRKPDDPSYEWGEENESADDTIRMARWVFGAKVLPYTLGWVIAYQNDEWYLVKTPDERWQAMRDWATKLLAEDGRFDNTPRRVKRARAKAIAKAEQTVTA